MKRLLLLLIPVLLILAGCHSATEDTPPHTQGTTSPPAAEITEEVLPMETIDVHLHTPKDSDLVRVRDYIPDIQEDLKYATPDNFTGSVIYPFREVWLRYGTVKKLICVQEELRVLGLSLKIWDGFRPISAQFRLWEIYPNDTYVADPNKGFSNHSRGNAVDITLVDKNGMELEMPTEFDDFSGLADRDYSEIPPLPRANAELLEQIMQKHGFQGYYGEWWHFNDTHRYDPEWVLDPGLVSLWQVSTEQDAPVTEPHHPDQVLASLSPGTIVTLLGYDGDRALVSWNGLRGYMDCTHLSPCSD